MAFPDDRAPATDPPPDLGASPDHAPRPPERGVRTYDDGPPVTPGARAARVYGEPDAPPHAPAGAPGSHEDHGPRARPMANIYEEGPAPVPTRRRRGPSPAVWALVLLALATVGYLAARSRGRSAEAPAPPDQTTDTARNTSRPTASVPAPASPDEFPLDESQPDATLPDATPQDDPPAEVLDGPSRPPRTATTPPAAERNTPVARAPEPAPSAEPEETADRPAPDAALSVAEANAFADEHLEYGTAGRLGDLESRYAERVAYFDRGVVSRATVAQDKRAYVRRWPERSYDRRSDAVVTPTADGATVRFDHAFEVARDGRGIRGEAWTELTLRRDGDGFRVVGERGGVRRRSRF